MSWRKKYAESIDEDIFPICKCRGHFWRVSWAWSDPLRGVWVAPSCVRKGWKERIRGALSILRMGFTWADDIILTEETCRWLGGALIERANIMRDVRNQRNKDLKNDKGPIGDAVLHHFAYEAFASLELIVENMDDEGRCQLPDLAETRGKLGKFIRLVRGGPEAIQRKTT